MNPKEKFNFERKIIQRVIDGDTEELTLECGHETTCVTPWPNDVIYCSQCLHVWIEKQKANPQK